MIDIDAMRWKYPTAEFIAIGELEYKNIVWKSTMQPTEAELAQAEIDHQAYMQNTKPLEDAKKAKIQSLREQHINRAIKIQMDRVNAATSQSEIDIITLP